MAKYGIPVVGFADYPRHFCCRTNTCNQVIATDTSNEELINSLVSFGKNLDQKAVIIPCSDNSVQMISLHRKELEEFYNIILPEHKILELFMDKGEFYKYCQLNGFPIPPTFFPTDESDLENIADNINFPCIIKPRRADNRWWKFYTEKVLKVEDPKQLYDQYNQSLRATDAPMVQEWILGGDSNLNSCTFYYNRKYEPVITYTSRKLRQWPVDNGDICLGEEIRNDALAEYAVKLMGSVKFCNVGSLEMKKNDRDGQYYMMEVNVCRLPMRFQILEAGGVELLHTMYSEAAGIPIVTNTTQQFKGAKWIALHNDILASWAYHKRGELSFIDWIHSLRGINSFAVTSVRDPLPSIIDAKTLAGRAFRFIGRKIASFLSR